MAPYLEEVDVFAVPHSRMKQLVEGYCTKISITDFASYEATDALLRCLYYTFREFKSHETIENRLIMKILKNKLDCYEPTKSEIVCNCHSDNRLSEMLQLVIDGYSFFNNQASSDERIRYGRKLEATLNEFTKKFLPHMEEEEEVFQPMLMKYFGYDELKNLKQKVIELHEKMVRKQVDNELEKFRMDEEEQEEIETETMDEVISNEILPPEIIVEIFTYLRPPELGVCAQVCKRWRDLARKPGLWRKLLPIQWAGGNWNSLTGVYYPDEDPLATKKVRFSCVHQCEHECNPRFCVLRERRHKEFIDNIRDHLLPYIGVGVTHVSFAGCALIGGEWLPSFLCNLPNLLHLDLSYTELYDDILENMKKEYRSVTPFCPKLTHLNCTGCSLSDRGFRKLIYCLFSNAHENKIFGNGLEILNLGGCFKITDETFSFLMTKTLITESLNLLNVSGCWSVTGEMLCKLTDACLNLDPKKLYYCDFVRDGPFQAIANGCQNLENDWLYCCCSENSRCLRY